MRTSTRATSEAAYPAAHGGAVFVGPRFAMQPVSYSRCDGPDSYCCLLEAIVTNRGNLVFYLTRPLGGQGLTPTPLPQSRITKSILYRVPRSFGMVRALLALLLCMMLLPGCARPRSVPGPVLRPAVQAANPERAEAAVHLAERAASAADDLIGRASLPAQSRVAVLPIASPDGNTTSLGILLAEKIAARLVGRSRWQIVDRANLTAILAERDLAHTDLADPKHAVSTAKLLSAEFLVTGTLVDARDRVEASLKVLHGQSGASVAMTTLHIAKDDHIRSLMVYVQRPKPQNETVPAPAAASPPGSRQDQVVREADYVTATVWVTAGEELARLQRARHRARALYADYIVSNVIPSADRDRLLELARDTEQLLDAEEDGDTIRYKVRFPIPQAR